MKNLSLLVFILGALACGESMPPPGAPLPGESTSGVSPKNHDSEKCKAAEPSKATDLSACLAGCESLDEKAPEGTRCLSPRAACKAECNTTFKK